MPDSSNQVEGPNKSIIDDLAAMCEIKGQYHNYPKWEPECGCRFENDFSNAVILCDECAKLPCHNPPNVKAS